MAICQGRRVVLIVDTAIEAPIVEYILRAGAHGYNCIYCVGKGRHQVREDSYTRRSLARIEVLVREEIAELIMDFVHEPEFNAYPLIAYMDLVDIDPRDTHFL